MTKEERVAQLESELAAMGIVSHEHAERSRRVAEKVVADGAPPPRIGLPMGEVEKLGYMVFDIPLPDPEDPGAFVPVSPRFVHPEERDTEPAPPDYVADLAALLRRWLADEDNSEDGTVRSETAAYLKRAGL